MKTGGPKILTAVRQESGLSSEESEYREAVALISAANEVATKSVSEIR
jgi:hypothetical protein